MRPSHFNDSFIVLLLHGADPHWVAYSVPTFLLAPDIWWGFWVKTAYMRSNQKKESEINQNQNQTENRTRNTTQASLKAQWSAVQSIHHPRTPLCNQSPLQDATPTNLIANSYSKTKCLKTHITIHISTNYFTNATLLDITILVESTLSKWFPSMLCSFHDPTHPFLFHFFALSFCPSTPWLYTCLLTHPWISGTPKIFFLSHQT